MPAAQNASSEISGASGRVFEAGEGREEGITKGLSEVLSTSEPDGWGGSIRDFDPLPSGSLTDDCSRCDSTRSRLIFELSRETAPDGTSLDLAVAP